MFHTQGNNSAYLLNSPAEQAVAVPGIGLMGLGVGQSSQAFLVLRPQELQPIKRRPTFRKQRVTIRQEGKEQSSIEECKLSVLCQ